MVSKGKGGVLKAKWTKTKQILGLTKKLGSQRALWRGLEYLPLEQCAWGGHLCPCPSVDIDLEKNRVTWTAMALKVMWTRTHHLGNQKGALKSNLWGGHPHRRRGVDTVDTQGGVVWTLWTHCGEWSMRSHHRVSGEHVARD
jgi:hypothetical protein